jgi:predicted Zn-dependent peptidase
VEASKVEGLLWEEVEKVKQQGISAEELNKAKRQFIAGQIMSRQQVLNKAEAIQHARFMHGDIESVNSDLDKYNAVTVADVKRVANKYLVTPNRTVVTVVPAAKKPTT